jgi:phage portal protein BeeE
MPLFKIGASTGSAGSLSVEAQQQLYLNDCLHILIEDLELCLDEGLELKNGYHAEVDEEGLLRMDQAALYDALGKAVGACIMKPNEARRKLRLAPAPGGDSLYLQQQNYSLEALAKRDAKEDPFSTTPPKPEPAPAPAPALPAPADPAADQAAAAKALADALIAKFTEAAFHA